MCRMIVSSIIIRNIQDSLDHRPRDPIYKMYYFVVAVEIFCYSEKFLVSKSVF